MKCKKCGATMTMKGGVCSKCGAKAQPMGAK